MADALKDMYNRPFFDDLIAVFGAVYPAFNRDDFLTRLYDAAWEERALKERMRHITTILLATLPDDYRAALDVLKQAAPLLTKYNFQVMFFPDFVEVYGLDDWQASLPALEMFTQYSSAEFAVRPYIVQDAARMMAQMLAWARHENPHVRRLASEGCRPRLPWAMALPDFKRDPSPILPILEQLKDDPSDYVRRSVANNLNDIAKDHPQVVIDLLRRWQTIPGENTAWITQRALRTLVKVGNSEALGLLGYEGDTSISVSNLQLSARHVRIGESLAFSFDVELLGDDPQNLMIDYVISFYKANGKRAPKVFKLSKKQLQPGQKLHVEKTHSFRLITTRVYYPGEHTLSLKINGQVFDHERFMLE